MKSVIKTLQQLLMKKSIRNLKKVIEWWKLKEIILKEKVWFKKLKEKILIKPLDKMHKYKTISYYCLKCRKNTENINTKILGTSIVRYWYF